MMLLSSLYLILNTKHLDLVEPGPVLRLGNVDAPALLGLPNLGRRQMKGEVPLLVKRNRRRRRITMKTHSKSFHVVLSSAVI